MASDIWIDLPLSSLGFLNHFGYVYTTFDMNHAHGMLPDTAASQEAHKQFVWANQVVRPRLWDDTCWDVLQDHLGPVSEWMAVCLSVCGNCGALPWLAAEGFSRLCWEQWCPVTATRVTQESRISKTSMYNLVQMLTFELWGAGIVLLQFYFNL